MNETQSKGIRVEVDMTKLYVSHLDRELTFIHPHKGQNTYFKLLRKIKKKIESFAKNKVDYYKKLIIIK